MLQSTREVCTSQHLNATARSQPIHSCLLHTPFLSLPRCNTRTKIAFLLLYPRRLISNPSIVKKQSHRIHWCLLQKPFLSLALQPIAVQLFFYCHGQGRWSATPPWLTASIQPLLALIDHFFCKCSTLHLWWLSSCVIRAQVPALHLWCPQASLMLSIFPESHIVISLSCNGMLT